jgi:hypothetical protein
MTHLRTLDQVRSETGRTDDKLENFLRWFLKNCPPIGVVPLMKPHYDISGIMGVTWYRKKQFQVQMFIVPPNFIVPEHCHPNVDSFEIDVGGQIRFSHNGVYVTPINTLEATKRGTSKNRGSVLRVKPNDLHGGMAGPEGGIFMSVQHWLNGVEPHCVSRDYDGIALSQEHAKTITFGNVIVKEKFDLRDIAHNE